MNKTNNFKKFEKNLLIVFVNISISFKKKIGAFFKFFFNIGNKRLTLMLVPHSERKTFNLKLNLFFLFFGIFISLAVIGGLVFFTFDNYNKSVDFINEKVKIQTNEKQTKDYQKMLNDIFSMQIIFKGKLKILTTHINSPAIKAYQEIEMNMGGAPNIIDEKQTNDFDNVRYEYGKLVKDYELANVVLSELSKKTEDYDKILSELPFGSPVIGGFLMTCPFGLRIHPITKMLDNHTGVDLANISGTQIVSTAPGIVEKVEWNPTGYGWYVKINHNKVGFSTLYGHLRSEPLVKPGDKVKKGQVIGYMGATGVATGVHLHYEVQLGNTLQDPWDYVANY